MTEFTPDAGASGNSRPRPDDPVDVHLRTSAPSDPRFRPFGRGRSRLVLAPLLTAVLLGVGAACGSEESADLSPEAERGRQIANSNGCASCHGLAGQGGAGPGWEGLYGSEIELEDGSTVIADEAYLELAIVEPEAQIHAGYQLRMPANDLTADEVDAVVAYIRELGTDPDAGEAAAAGGPGG